MKEAFAAGKRVAVFQPGAFGPIVMDGDTSIEGPHSPLPHTWYARVKVKNGAVTKVIS